MQNIRFENPEWLLLLLLLPALLYSYVRAHQGRRSSVQFSDLGVLGRATTSLWTKLRHGLLVLRILGLGCLIAAMARPQSGREVREISGEGIDIMLTLDLSPSMEQNDLAEGQKSRLQVAKEVVADFIAGRHSDRIGMVVFARESFTLCPLTLDYRVLLEFLKGVEIASKAWYGTAIGMALINACNRLRDSDAESRVIILLTDGENNAGEVEPLTAAEAAAAVGIRVYTIGVGSVRGDRRLDEETLQEVAARTGGQYYRATSEEKLAAIYREIGELEATEITSEIHLSYSERFAYFLYVGLGLLLVEMLLAHTRFRSLP